MAAKNKWAAYWCTGCLVLICGGLLFSRAVLSIASTAIALPYLLFWSRVVSKDKYALTGVLVMILPVMASGLWSDDLANWRNSLLVRLPLLLIGLGIAAAELKKANWLFVAAVFITGICSGCCWSLWMYAANPEALHAAYLKAKVLPTPADGDYVRFSWMVVVAVILCIKCFGLATKKNSKILLMAAACFLIVYLHILATKTGLICLYTCVFVAAGYLVFIKENGKAAMATVFTALLVFLLAYATMPTLRNRIQYVRYDFSQYFHSGAAPGYNDAARWVSIKAGWGITSANPAIGVGFGDMRTAINNWHQQYQPNSFAYERFLPANEWLVYGTGSGWPGVVCFTLGLGLVIYHTARRQLLSVLLAIIAIIPLITDDSFEGQFGAVLLGFISFFGQQNPNQANE